MLLGTLALFVVSLGYGVVVPLLPELAGGREATDEALLSAVYAAYAATKIGAQVPGGVWVDRAGPERVMRLALVAYAVSLGGFLVGQDLRWFSLVRAVEGAATGLVYPAAFALALRDAPVGREGRRLGAMAGIGTSGLLVGPALGGWLGEGDPHLPVWVALAATGPVILWSFTLARREVTRTPRTLKAELAGLARLAGTASFVALMLPIAFNKLTFSSFQGLLPLWGPDVLGVGTRGVTAYFVLTGVCFGLAQPIAGHLADRGGARPIVLAAALPMLGALAALRWTDTPVGFGVAYGAYVMLASVMFTATMKHAAVTFGTADTYGGLFGMLGTLTDLMTIVGPLLFLNLYAGVGASVGLWMAAIGVPFFVLYAARAPRGEVAT